MIHAANIRWIKSQTFHARHGQIENAFRYNFDSLIVPVRPPARSPLPWLRAGKGGLFSFNAGDHGDGSDLQVYACRIAREYGFEDVCDGKIELITQPRCLGYIFNPVCFWAFYDTSQNLRAVIAEVNNTVGQRHSYLVHHADLRPIETSDKIKAQKLFHVSPFQSVKGNYVFKFDLRADRFHIVIDHQNDQEGVFANMTGRVVPLTRLTLIRSFLTKPFGAMRVIFLIHWQAVKLKLKGAVYRRAPEQKSERISR